MGSMIGVYGSSASVISNRRLVVSGCKRIAEYSSCRVSLELCDQILTVEGRELTVRAYCGDELEISGYIDAVRFKEGCVGR